MIILTPKHPYPSLIGKSRKDVVKVLLLLCNDVLVFLQQGDDHFVLLAEPVDLDKVTVTLLSSISCMHACMYVSTPLYVQFTSFLF